MTHAPGSMAARDARRTRSNATVGLDRHSSMHRLVGTGVRAVEACATVLIFILISDAILALFLHGGPLDVDVTPATPLERASYWIAYAFTLAEVLLRPRQILRTALRNPFILCVVAVGALSVLWSDDPSTSIRKAVALATWTMFGLFLATRYDTRELLRYLALALGIIAVLSLATVLLKPDYGIETSLQRAWRGVFTTKNVLGEMMLLAAVVFACMASRPGIVRAMAIICFALSVVLIFFAKAIAALLIVPVLAVMIPIVFAFRRNNAAAALLLCCLLGVSAAASVTIAEQDTVLRVLGKDATLTGRTVLWGEVIKHIEERPMLGYGYGAFWEPSARASERVRAAIGWDAPHSHNGLLDIWLDLGLPGALSLLAAYILALRRAWTGLRARVTIDGLWAMSFLVMLFLGNTTESSVVQSQLIWAIFVAVACMRWPHISRDANVAYAGAPARGGARRNAR